MISDLKPYPMMKYSGMPWVEKVPEHWELRRLKTLCSMRSGEAITAMSIEPVGAYPVYGGNGVRGYASNYTHDGNFALIGRQGALCGNVRIAHGRFWASEHAVVVSLRPGYVLEWFGSILTAMNLNQHSIAAAQPGLAVECIMNLWLPIPSAQEQKAIADFLGNYSRIVNHLIRTKQKLIKLLEEQKQAIIHRAVTRGLDPSVPLKPSGVQWLGDIPEHWNVKRCRYLFREIDERSLDGSEEHLSMSQRLGLVPSHLVENAALLSESYAGGKLCEDGDLVLNRLKAHLGVFALARYRGVISPDYTVFRPTAPESGAYFEAVLRSPACRPELRIRAKGIVEGFWRLYTDDFYDIKLPVPPISERHEIIASIQCVVLEIDRISQYVNKEIILLSEYSARLISDVVTGKLDVRGIDLPATEDTETPEEYTTLLESEEVMEHEGLQEELPAEGD